MRNDLPVTGLVSFVKISTDVPTGFLRLTHGTFTTHLTLKIIQWKFIILFCIQLLNVIISLLWCNVVWGSGTAGPTAAPGLQVRTVTHTATVNTFRLLTGEARSAVRPA